MKIGIDARMMHSSYGLGRYVQELVNGVYHKDTTHTFVIFLRKKNFHSIKESAHIKKVLADIPWYSIKEQLKMPGLMRKQKLDLMHFPHWNVPFFCPVPYVVTIHDLIMFHYKRREATTHGPLMYWIKDKAHRFLVKHVVKKAKHIIATTDFTKQDLHRTLHVPLEKMTTIYQAPFKHIEDKEQTGTEWQDVFERFNIDKPYAMFVGQAYPHKNVHGLLRAWKRFEEEYADGQYQLLLIGKENTFWKKILDSDEMKSCNHVIYTGFVSDQILQTLYAQASLYVSPSLYEGFGLPPLEAMRHSVPVVSSNRSCFPEVLGEAALYVDPENQEQFADAIHQGLTDDDIRLALKRKGKEERKRFETGRFVGETLRIYET